MTSIIAPVAKLFAWVLAGFYSVIPSYGWSIVLLTLTTMIVVFPLTRKGTRSMMQMQLLQPELLAMRSRYKKSPNMTAEEKREQAQAQQKEMMELYRENGVSPTGGCLPMLLQFPVFIVLYNVIKGMTRFVPGVGKNAKPVYSPIFINTKTALHKALEASHGKLESFGINLADSVRTHQAHWIDVMPYVAVILVAVALQYVSIWQITNRNPSAANANPQMQMVQKFMPLIFIVIYINFGAGIGVYFIVSSLFRIGQQEWMYKRDPHITKAVAQIVERQKNAPPPLPGAKPKGFRARMAELSGTASLESAQSAQSAQGPARSTRPPSKQGQRPGPARAGQNRTSGAKPGAAKAGAVSAAKPARAAGAKPTSGAKPQPGGKSGRPGPRPAVKPAASGVDGGVRARNRRLSGEAPASPNGASKLSNGQKPMSGNKPSTDGAGGS